MKNKITAPAVDVNKEAEKNRQQRVLMINEIKERVQQENQRDSFTMTYEGKEYSVVYPDILNLRDWASFPAIVKIRMMGLTADDCAAFIIEEKNNNLNILDELMYGDWRWKITGDKVDFNDLETIGDLEYGWKEFVKKMKSKKGLPYHDICKAIDFFTNERSEVYDNNEREEEI